MENDELAKTRCQKANDFAVKLNAAVRQVLLPKFENREFNSKGCDGNVWQIQIKTEPLNEANEADELDAVLKECVSKFIELELSPVTREKTIRCFCNEPFTVIYRCMPDYPPRYLAKGLVGYLTEEEYANPKPMEYIRHDGKKGWVDIDA